MKYLFIAISLLYLTSGCSTSNSKENATHQCISPLGLNTPIDSTLNNSTIAAAFNVNDFNWQEGKLSITVYHEYIYDAVAVSQMQMGDTIIYEDTAIPIDSVKVTDKFVIINGGIEQGGTELCPYEGGTYRAVSLDDHSVYKEIGKANVTLPKDFTLIDCGENPTDPCDTICAGQKAYINQLPEHRQNFNPLNTRIRIEKGIVKEINRRWIP